MEIIGAEADKEAKFDYDEYSRAMRSSFCNKEMVKKDGEINHAYFLQKKGSYFGEQQEFRLLDSLGAQIDQRGLENPAVEDFDISRIKEEAKLQDFVSLAPACFTHFF